MAQLPNKSWRIVGAVTILSIPLLVLSVDANKDDPSTSSSEIQPKAQQMQRNAIILFIFLVIT